MAKSEEERMVRVCVVVRGILEETSRRKRILKKVKSSWWTMTDETKLTALQVQVLCQNELSNFRGEVRGRLA